MNGNARDTRRAWPYLPGSLTKQLRRVCGGRLCVYVVGEDWVRADAATARDLLLRRGVRVWRREVLLKCDDQAWLHAVSFVGASALKSLGLRRLGQRPLGEVLFRRGSRCLRRRVLRRFGAADEQTLWRRSAVFEVHGHRVLLHEDFLAALPPRRV